VYGKFFLHFHVEMAHFVGILAVNFKFYCMNKTVKTPKSNVYREYDATKRGKQYKIAIITSYLTVIRTASATDGASPPTFTDVGCTVAIIAAPVHTSELS